MLRSVEKKSGESVELVAKKKRTAMVREKQGYGGRKGRRRCCFSCSHLWDYADAAIARIRVLLRFIVCKLLFSYRHSILSPRTAKDIALQTRPGFLAHSA